MISGFQIPDNGSISEDVRILKSIVDYFEGKFSSSRASDIAPQKIEDILNVLTRIKNKMDLKFVDNDLLGSILSLENSCYSAISLYSEPQNRTFYYESLQGILAQLLGLLERLRDLSGDIPSKNEPDQNPPNIKDEPKRLVSTPEAPDDEDKLAKSNAQNNKPRKSRNLRRGLPQPLPNETEESPRYREIDKNPKTDSDRPSGSDKLNYSKYADAFAKVILNHETNTPLTVGIYGQWGQGKSFLMGKIREALDNQHKKKEGVRDGPSFWKSFRWWSILVKLGQWSKGITLERFVAFMDKISEVITLAFSGLLLIVVHPRIINKKYRLWQDERKKARAEVVDYHIVEFNAWAYVGTDHLWAGLVTQLYKEAEKYFGFQLHVARLGKAIKKSLPKSILIFAFYALLGVGVSLLLDFNKIQATWDTFKITVNAFAGSIIAGSAIASLPTFLTTLKEFADNLVLSRSRNLQNLAARPDFRAQIGLMAEIKAEIGFIGNLLRKGKSGHPTRFILLIDDLDRCEHKKAVEVMQAIMLLLTDEDGAPFVIFMGIDARVIVHAIEETYGEVLVKAGINGYEYLDKIVQIPFVIPGAPPADIERYVDSMLWSEDEKALFTKKKALAQPPTTASTAPSNEGAPPKQQEVTIPLTPSTPLDEISVSFTEIERAAINQCAKYLVDNPRKIKRIVNIYRYARLILPAEQNRPKAVRWYLMVEQWPLHVAWILEYIENDQQQTKSKLIDKTILNVYKLAKKNIRSKEMAPLLTIDADPDNFSAFIEKNDFTVQEILALLPITFNLNPAIRSEVSKQMLKISETKPKRKKPATQNKLSATIQSK